MEIADRDLKLALIKKAIKDNNDFVVGKVATLEKAKKENEFLASIYNDYKTYYDHMVEQKRREKGQLLFLSGYLEKSIEEAGLTDAAICKARHAQKNILRNLELVRSDLDTFVGRDTGTENQNNISL